MGNNMYDYHISSFYLIMHLDVDSVVVSVNESSIVGVNVDFRMAVGRRLFDFFVFDNFNIDVFHEKLSKLEVWHSKASFFDNDNKRHNVYVTFIKSRNKMDSTIACTIMCNIIKPDIKDLEDKIFGLQYELANKEVLISEYKALLNKSTAIVKVDNESITYANKNCERMFGYLDDEIIGKSIFFVIDNTNKMHKIANMMWHRLLASGYAKTQLTCMHKSGRKVYVQAYFMIMKSVRNETETVGILHDVTEIYNTHEELENIQKDVIFAMGSISEGRSKETGNHVKRVAEYSYLLARLYGLDEDKSNLLRTASPMHDIGKMTIPDSILHKKGKLTEDEFEVMKTHAIKGYEMLSFSNREVIQTAAQISLTHHEWWNGEGYPNGISSYDIPLFGRITAIADVFDALSNDRCYKKAWPVNEVIDYITSQKGKQFEPCLVDLLVNNIDDFLRVKSLFDDESI